MHDCAALVRQTSKRLVGPRLLFPHYAGPQERCESIPCLLLFAACR